ncbi:nucleotide 5'-monophosphate nucleosidase PpnN [Shewanella sp. YIC-542]|uniref:nucleotide 5'-monophosphate nucleosidase PpnN n=1 Tax=Shewanella mytili TaxID=3377111 RepID=UPI00398EB122
MIVKVNPRGSMDQLSQLEVDLLKQSAQSELYQLYRNCSLAVLASGSDTDDARALFKQFEDFDIDVVRRERGVKLELHNPPACSFVDDQIIVGIQEHLFAVLRDIIYVSNKYSHVTHLDFTNSNHITNVVFDILRNSRVISPMQEPNVVVCWGGHSISEYEYKYTKSVGYELGLRKLDICTGCGPGAMKGPMKGAAIGHAKQRIHDARYIGITEPGIIAAEPPNQIVNELVIMPDIEKRLEAFVRMGHGIIIFPGGPGTAEELLYLLGILLNEQNREIPFPLVLAGPAGSAAYFSELDAFIGATLGPDAQRRYQIIIDDPAETARVMRRGMEEVKAYRKYTGDAYQYQWRLKIDADFQLPFVPTHDSMENLDLHFQQDKAKLAANLRKAFSGIVAGNVKKETILSIEQQGPFCLSGDPQLMSMIDKLLNAFVAQGRMKLPGSTYVPCYRVCQ